MHHLVFLLLLGSIVGCRRAPAPPAVVDAALSSPALPASAAVASAIASPLAVNVTNVGPGEFELTSEGGSLATAARIERRQDDGSWRALEHLDLDRGYRLVDDCAKAEACVQAAEVRPLPWKGFNCSAQCNGTCRANSWEGPGTFRLSVSSCDGKKTAPGPPFELPDGAHLHSAARLFAVSDVLSVTAMRLDIAAHSELSDAPSADRVAGFHVRGPERLLDAAHVSELAALLRSDNGFDDDIVQRCAMDHLVGFRITHQLVSLGAPRKQVVDMVIDFTCRKLFLARGDGPKRAVHASHFVATGPLLTLVRSAFPSDKELAALRSSTP